MHRILPSYLAINACNSDFLFRPALVLQQDRQLKEADLKYKALFTAAVNQLHNHKYIKIKNLFVTR